MKVPNIKDHPRNSLEGHLSLCWNTNQNVSISSHIKTIQNIQKKKVEDQDFTLQKQRERHSNKDNYEAKVARDIIQGTQSSLDKFKLGRILVSSK